VAYRCVVTNDSNRNDANTPQQANKGLFYLALICFFVGIAAIVGIFFVESSLFLYILTLACPLGFVLAIAYALRSGRRSR